MNGKDVPIHTHTQYFEQSEFNSDQQSLRPKSSYKDSLFDASQHSDQSSQVDVNSSVAPNQGQVIKDEERKEPPMTGGVAAEEEVKIEPPKQARRPRSEER